MNMEGLGNKLKTLRYRSEFRSFYEDAKSIGDGLDVIFTNIALLNRCTHNGTDQSTDLLDQFLSLLQHILNKWHLYPSNRNILDIARFCEIMQSIVNCAVEGCYLVRVNAVLMEIMGHYADEGDLVPLLNLLNVCLEKSREMELFPEVCLLVTACVKMRLYSEMASAGDWVLLKFGRFIQNRDTDKNICLALQCLLSLYKLPQGRRNVTSHLLECAERLVRLSSDQTLKTGCRQLLSEMITDFVATHNVPWKENYPSVSHSVTALPSRLEDWCQADYDIFFVIALMIDVHQNYVNLPWSPSKIFDAIVERVKKERWIIPPVLKAMCYFFPACGMRYNQDPATFAETSSRLINRLEYCGAFSVVIAPYEPQLTWIMMSRYASLSTKMKLLAMWLEDSNKMEVLCGVLRRYNLEEMLLLYIHQFPGDPISKNAAIAISTSENLTLRRRVFDSFLLNLSYIDLSGKLLLTKPDIPITETNQLLALCTAMGAILPLIRDRDVFVAACVFTVKLLHILKDQPKAMLGFCKNMENIKAIFGAAVAEDEGVGVNAANILIALLKFQVFHDLNIPGCIEANLVLLLRGSTVRQMTALKLINLIVRCRRVKEIYLNYAESTSLCLYQKLHEFRGTKLAKICYACMTYMLVGNPDFLTFSAVTYILMEMQWKYPECCVTSSDFLLFARLWFSYVRQKNIFDLPRGMEESILLRAVNLHLK